MSLPIPLSVRLSTARADRHIERDLRSLSFRSVAPGGFASAQFSLDRPLASSPDEIAYYGSVNIYDARNGNCVWCGRLEDPGRGAGSDGQVWELAAVGPSAHAQDRDKDYIVIDTQADRWERSDTSRRAVRTDQQINDPTGDELPSIAAVWPEPMTANSGDWGQFSYLALRRAGLELGRAKLRVLNAIDSSTWSDHLRSGSGGVTTALETADWSTSTHTLVGRAGTEIPAGHNAAFIQSRRIGVNATLTEDRFSRYDQLVVRALLKNADGSDITSGYNNDFVLAHQIVNDLLGRYLTDYDGAGATVDDSSTYQIDQAAWPDGITPAGVLDELMLLEPTKYWAAWEPTSTGLHRFEWRTWPTTVRYEADATDGFDSPGSAEGLYNAVTVRFRGAKGQTRTRRFTQAVPVLDDAGLVREKLLDVSDNVGSFTGAQQVGEQFLAEHQVPPNAGTLTVARPIYDHDRGTTAMPWEIRPGHLIRVRGVQPNTNSLNLTSRDGVTVFRVVAVGYDTASASATLELDSHSVTVSRALATLRQDIKRTRKR